MTSSHWKIIQIVAVTITVGLQVMFCSPVWANSSESRSDGTRAQLKQSVQRPKISARPGFLIDAMRDGRLKNRLKSCEKGPFRQTKFSIAHRGAPLQYPEHTRESYIAAARQGAGIQECDVTFTLDGELVCRHAECDLHTTTNIVTTDLNNKCTVPWGGDPLNPGQPNPTTVRCCASDLTIDEFKSLEGKMDAADRSATTAEEFLGGTADWRTDLHTSRGTLLTHKESIRLFNDLNADFTPELKSGDPARLMAVFGGATPEEAQARYAQALIDDYVEAGIDPARVWPQSFNLDDVLYWVEEATRFGRQAVYLDSRYMGEIDPLNGDPATFSPSMTELRAQGVRVIAPPMYFLLRVRDDGRIEPSSYARAARDAGLKIIAWTFERSDLRNGSRVGVDAEGNPSATFYYRFDVNPAAHAIQTDSDMYEALDVLARKVKILGIFSDWPETVTYYANCMGLD